MFYDYIKKLLPIPIKEIKASKDGYRYLITSYSSIVTEPQTEEMIKKRINKCKKIKSFNGWYYKKGDLFYKEAIIEFVNEN